MEGNAREREQMATAFRCQVHQFKKLSNKKKGNPFLLLNHYYNNLFLIKNKMQ